MSDQRGSVLVLERPDPIVRDDLASFDAAGSSAVSDALGKAGALSGVIRPVTSHTRMVGTAVTVVSSPNDNLLPYLALPEIRPGDILVIATGGMEQSCALLGGTILGHLKNAGAGGVLTDGFVRDLDEIEALGLPVYAAGFSTRAPTKSGSGAINVPVAIGGLVVQANDVVVADRDGVTIVPARQVATVASALAPVLEREARMLADVQAGHSRPEWLRDGVYLADVTVERRTRA